jgi:hypothetical protein
MIEIGVGQTTLLGYFPVFSTWFLGDPDQFNEIQRGRSCRSNEAFLSRKLGLLPALSLRQLFGISFHPLSMPFVPSDKKNKVGLWYKVTGATYSKPVHYVGSAACVALLWRPGRGSRKCHHLHSYQGDHQQ